MSPLCVSDPPPGGLIGCSPPHAPLEGSFHVWPWGSLDNFPRGLSHATPLERCCVTVHDPSPAHDGGSCHPDRGFPPYGGRCGGTCPPRLGPAVVVKRRRWKRTRPWLIAEMEVLSGPTLTPAPDASSSALTAGPVLTMAPASSKTAAAATVAATETEFAAASGDFRHCQLR